MWQVRRIVTCLEYIGLCRTFLRQQGLAGRRCWSLWSRKELLYWENSLHGPKITGYMECT